MTQASLPFEPGVGGTSEAGSGLAGGILIDDVFLSELVDTIGLDGVLEAMGYFRDEAAVRVSAILHAVAV